MDVLDQCVTDSYALYNGDCMKVTPHLADGSVHLTVYSPPFAGLYHYSSSERDSHWIWRQYASAFWDDVRIDRVLPFRAARDDEDEKHVHPLQLDVIDRILVLWSNPGETVLTPFMGVGSEVYSAVRARRRAIGVELKPSYYRQAVKNVAAAQPESAGQLAMGSAA